MHLVVLPSHKRETKMENSHKKQQSNKEILHLTLARVCASVPMCVCECVDNHTGVIHHQHYSYRRDSHHAEFHSEKSPGEVNNQLHLSPNHSPRHCVRVCVCMCERVNECKRKEAGEKRAEPRRRTEGVLLRAGRVFFPPPCPAQSALF